MTSPSHSSMSGQSLHEDKRVKEPVRAASTANVNTSSPGATLDGVTLSGGDRVLLKNQTTASQNGIYVWATSITALTRASDATAATDFVYGFLVYVREGTSNGGSWWTYTTTTTPTVGSTSLTFTPFGAGTGTVSSVALTVPSSELSVTGSPITNSGTLAISKVSQSANTIAAGPASGGSAAWAFRTMVPADMPVFGASGASHSAGAAPDPGGTPGTTKFLREDSTWQVPSGGGSGGSSSGTGGSGALVPIAVVGRLTAPQSTLVFSGIPQTGFRNLHIRLFARGTVAGGGLTSAVDVGLRANNDTAANYDWTNSVLYQSGEQGYGAQADTAAYVTKVPASGAATNLAGTASIVIPDYTNTTFEKSFSSTGTHKSGTSTSQQYATDGAGFWRSTAVISDLTLLCVTGDFDIGSYACLYGEMDTAGVLLTPASNLIQDTLLLASASSISIPNIPQNYRDLVIEVQARGDTAGGGLGNSVDVGFQVNGDTTANYDWTNQIEYVSGAAGYEAIGATAAFVAKVSSLGAAANMAGSFRCVIPNYSINTGFHKGMASNGESRLGTSASQQYATTGSGRWRSAVPITSLLLLPVAGNFLAGTTVRVYGEPVSAGGASAGTGTRLRISANQSIADVTDTLVSWDTEDSDADNQHFTSAANLTGTVTKAAASATLTGTGTAFTTELSAGQVISVPGTAAEKRVVIKITSNTLLTVNTPYVNTASGQTAARLNTPIVFRQPGQYTLTAGSYWASNATGFRKLAFVLNDTTVVAQSDQASIGATAMGLDLTVQRPFQQWDFVEVQVRQNSGGALNLTADERTFFASSSRPTVIVAVPYVCVRDEKAAGTSGGSFTSGAWRTRTLNTIQSDDAGIASIATNQVTLPPGRYRTVIRAPGYGVNDHMARLQNITLASTILEGIGSRATSSNAYTLSVIAGKFTLSTTTVLEVQHQCETTNGTDGFGRAMNLTTPAPSKLVYTVAEFWKEG